RRLAQQAAETQARAKHLAQWRDTALAAEGTGEIDAAQVAARRWLEMAPGDAEAQALLARLDAAQERAQGTAAPAGAGRQRPAKSAVADRQERAQGTAAPASAGQQWHAESIAADRQETEPDVKPLVAADMPNTAPGKRIWWPTSLIAIGWIFGWIIS